MEGNGRDLMVAPDRAGRTGATAEPVVTATWGDGLAEYYDNHGFSQTVGYGRRPAVLVVDMANAFTDPRYRLGADMDATVGHVARLLAASRAADVPIIYTVSGFGSPPEEIGTAALKVPSLAELQLGTPATEVDKRLQPADGDIIIVKKYWSSFMMTNLLPVLVYKGIDTLIITGNSTSGCVRAAATDALCYGFRPIVPIECVADRSEGPHRANLFDINAKFGDVVTLDEVLDYIKAITA